MAAVPRPASFRPPGALEFFVHPGGDLPIYRQVARQIRAAIAGRRLQAGDRLPSHRELAARLVIAPLTVKKAYDELEGQGLIETRRGLGTFVHARPGKTGMERGRKRLREYARLLLTQAVISGVPLGRVIEILQEAQTELEAERARNRPKGKAS